ncbi:MAG: MBL fold metallo-hydrolase [Desulfobacter sp.]|nr:MAG: MBL fold metallo-hydrolase [Desulfobacter sp.]
MKYRISPMWWPALAVASPLLVLMLIMKSRRFSQNIEHARTANRQLMSQALPLALPELDYLEMTILVEHRHRAGFGHAPGVSYFLETDQGSLLFDLGYGDEDPALEQNIEKTGVDLSMAEALVISHLHPDHMGGFTPFKQNRIPLPSGCRPLKGRPCYVPDVTASDDFDICRMDKPGLLPAGMATTGPLARSLFLMGPTLEQALLARIKGKGLVVITGCGHPTIETILEMARHLTDEPVYAVVGGLHLPVTESPLKKPGLQVQMIWGTGKPPWQRISDQDVDRAVAALNRAGTKEIYLSSHDICDYAIARLDRETDGRLTCLEAGNAYRIMGE